VLSVSRIQAVVGAALADAKIQHLRIRGEWVVNEHLSEFGGFTLLGLRAADSVIKAPFDDVARVPPLATHNIYCLTRHLEGVVDLAGLVAQQGPQRGVRVGAIRKPPALELGKI